MSTCFMNKPFISTSCSAFKPQINLKSWCQIRINSPSNIFSIKHICGKNPSKGNIVNLRQQYMIHPASTQGNLENPWFAFMCVKIIIFGRSTLNFKSLPWTQDEPQKEPKFITKQDTENISIIWTAANCKQAMALRRQPPTMARVSLSALDSPTSQKSRKARANLSVFKVYTPNRKAGTFIYCINKNVVTLTPPLLGRSCRWFQSVIDKYHQSGKSLNVNYRKIAGIYQ